MKVISLLFPSIHVSISTLNYKLTTLVFDQQKLLLHAVHVMKSYVCQITTHLIRKLGRICQSCDRYCLEQSF